MSADRFIESIIFNDLTIGQSASLTRVLTQDAISLFAAVSGDVNPAHLDPAYAQNTIFHGIIGHGMWTAALISTLLGTILPGPGTIYLGQDLHFKKPVHVGDTLTVTVTVAEKKTDKPVVVLDCLAENQTGEAVLTGKAVVLAPVDPIRMPRPELPEAQVQRHQYFQELMTSCNGLAPLRTAIVHPVKADGLLAVAEATSAGLIEPVLIGPVERIRKAAAEANVTLDGWEMIDTPHSHAAAEQAAAMARDHHVDALMKGALHSDELLSAVLEKSAGLRCEGRISHVYLMDIPSYHKPLMITDAAINIAPDLLTKADICQNAIDLWRILYGFDKKPKVAVLAAVETINPKMQATLDAAALRQMAERGQITDAIIDGPLALDNAINLAAAQEKGLVSPVAGDADILVVPTIEAGNMIAKQLTFLGNADAAGIVVGARVPIILTSRADDRRARLMSCALAVRVADARAHGQIK